MSATPNKPPPSTPLRWLLPLVLLMALLPASYAGLYGRIWFRERRGASLEEQRTSLKGVLWFKPEFRMLVKRLKQHLPEGAGILVEPSEIDPQEPHPSSGRTRWFLYFNYYAYPLRTYTHLPKLSSGTRMDYPDWIRYHFDVLDVDESGLGIPGVVRRERLQKEVDGLIAERNIQWRLTYPISQSFRTSNVILYHREGGAWVPVSIEDLPAVAESAAKVLEADA